MPASTLTRANLRLQASAFAGVFGANVAGERARAVERARRALAREPGSPAAAHHGQLAVAATGEEGQSLATVDGCVCALVGALYEPGELARELRLPADAPLAELLVAAFRHRGTAMLADLRGEFTLLLWDERAARGVIASDQLGASPLFVRDGTSGLLFASELRTLLPMLPSRPGPDPVAMVHWLALGGPPAGRTFYESIARVPGGHAVELARDGWRIAPYWHPRYRTPAPIEPAEAAAAVRTALERALLRCSEGETTGVMLSGGIDSAAVAGIAVACGRKPASAYSAVFPEHPSIDESELIALLSSELSIPSHALPVRGGSVLSGAVDFSREWETPATSPNLFFWSEILRRAATDGVTAMLDGEGGDALFWLSPYLLSDRLLRGRVPSAYALARRFPSEAGEVLPRVALRLVRDWGLRGAVPYRAHRLRQRLRGSADLSPSWFTAASARLRFDTDPALDFKRTGAPRWWSSLLDEATGIGSGQVHDATRRRNAAVGLRARHPLLDVDLIELVLALPPEHAFDPRLSRPLLRESVRGLIPDRVRLRPSKSSFDALFHELLAGADLPRVRSLLLAPDAEVRAFVDPERMRADLFDAAPPSWPWALQRWALDVWRLLTAEIWLRHQAGRPLPTRAA
jgi:asparagine synthase (glutamine-hydrolysing)